MEYVSIKNGTGWQLRLPYDNGSGINLLNFVDQYTDPVTHELTSKIYACVEGVVEHDPDYIGTRSPLDLSDVLTGFSDGDFTTVRGQPTQGCALYAAPELQDYAYAGVWILINPDSNNVLTADYTGGLLVDSVTLLDADSQPVVEFVPTVPGENLARFKFNGWPEQPSSINNLRWSVTPAPGNVVNNRQDVVFQVITDGSGWVLPNMWHAEDPSFYLELTGSGAQYFTYASTSGVIRQDGDVQRIVGRSYVFTRTSDDMPSGQFTLGLRVLHGIGIETDDYDGHGTVTEMSGFVLTGPEATFFYESEEVPYNPVPISPDTEDSPDNVILTNASVMENQNIMYGKILDLANSLSAFDTEMKILLTIVGIDTIAAGASVATMINDLSVLVKGLPKSQKPLIVK